MKLWHQTICEIAFPDTKEIQGNISNGLKFLVSSVVLPMKWSWIMFWQVIQGCGLKQAIGIVEHFRNSYNHKVHKVLQATESSSCTDSSFLSYTTKWSVYAGWGSYKKRRKITF